MAEENGTGTIDQGAAAADFFDDSDVVNDDGSPLASKTDDGGSDEQKPTGEPKQPTATRQPKDQQAAPADPNAPKPQPKAAPAKGFDEFFFKPDEKSGEPIFDTERAMSFLSPDNARRFTQAPFKYKPEAAPVTPATPPKDEYETMLEEQQKYNDNLRSGLLMYKNVMGNVANRYRYNLPPEVQQLMSEADRDIEKTINDEISKKNRETMVQWQKNLEKRLSEKTQRDLTMNELKTKASVNLARHEAKFKDQFGDDQAFGKFMFGFGSDIMRKQFERETGSRLSDMTQAEATGKMGEWWHKIAAEPGDLDYMVNLVMSQWVMANKEHFFTAGKSAAQRSQAAQRKGRTSAPSNVNRQSAQPDEDKDMESAKSYFRGTSFGREEEDVPTI